MNAPRELKHFGFAFLIAAAGYFLLYWAIESFRPSKGPWKIEFTTNSIGQPTLLIQQSHLGISNVQVIIPSSAPAGFRPKEVTFNQPRPVPFDLPIGECIFLDTTFLPGTVTLRVQGREIELLPRVLVIDHQAHHWNPNATYQLPAANTAAQ